MSRKIWIVALAALFLAAGCKHEEQKAEAKPAAKEAKKESAKTIETAPAAASDKTVKAVTSAIDAWASAWEKKDVDGYLAAYAKDFAPEKGTRKEWAKQRRERISKAKGIRVTVGNPKVTSTGADSATATFTQIYESDSFSDQAKKTLELKKIDGKWLIVKETSG